MNALDQFPENLCQNDMQKMVNIIEGKSNITLRILDWFVTHYIKNIGMDDIHSSYKSKLSFYKKRHFDPFRRLDRLDYKYVINGEECELLTSVGQLNFFRWIFENNIMNIVEEHLDQIMNHLYNYINK